MKRLVAGIGLGLALCLGAAAVYAYVQLAHRSVGAYFTSDGVRIHYTREGHGPPVILVHGLAVNADINWRRNGVIDALKDAYTVIALDNRGHGLSEKPAAPDAYGRHLVSDVVHLMDHLKLDKAHVIGYSMGGFITLKLLTEYPERLLSAAPCAAGWDSTEDRQEVMDALVASLREERGFAPLLRLLEPDGEPSWLKLHLVDALLVRLNDQHAIAGVVAGLPELMVTEEALRANQVPVLSVVGSLDPLKVGIDRMQGVLAHHETVVLPGKDHLTTMRDARFPQALRAFLDQISGAEVALLRSEALSVHV